MSEELAVLNNNAASPAIIEPEEDNANWGDDDEIKPSYVSIKQALTENFDHLVNGTLFERATGQTWENNTIDMIILKMGKTRQWKPSAPKFVKDEKALCRSNNGKTPLVGVEGLIPQANKTKNTVTGEIELKCDNCPRNSWKGYDKDTKTGPKPTCERGFFILFIDRQTMLPYIYTASGQSVDPCEAMYDAVKKQAKLVKSTTGKMPFTYDFSVSMTTEKGNKAHKIKFTKIAKLTAEAAAKFGPLYEQFVTSRSQVEVVDVVDNTYDPVEDTGQVIEGETDAPVEV